MTSYTTTTSIKFIPALIGEMCVIVVISAICEQLNPRHYPLIYNDDYEICGVFPYYIRRKGSNRYINESVNNRNTYYCLSIESKYKTKHSILAVQWLGLSKNDKTLVVDHISRNHLDNHIDNLRLITHKENSKNITIHPIVDELPDDAIAIDGYVDAYYSDSEQACYYKNHYYPLLYDPQQDRYYVIIPYNQDKQNPHRIIFFTDA